MNPEMTRIAYLRVLFRRSVSTVFGRAVLVIGVMVFFYFVFILYANRGQQPAHLIFGAYLDRGEIQVSIFDAGRFWHCDAGGNLIPWTDFFGRLFFICADEGITIENLAHHNTKLNFGALWERCRVLSWMIGPVAFAFLYTVLLIFAANFIKYVMVWVVRGK